MAEVVKTSKNREKKIALVASLSEKYTKAKAVIFTNYQGLTHKQIEGLKKELKKVQSEFVVAKNSLLTRAINDKKLEGQHLLDGQTGTLFLYNDTILPLKALAKLIKELNLPNVKFGIMEGSFITGDDVLKLATLPTREVLLVQLVFGLKSPIYNLHRALNWNLQKLVITLNAVVLARPPATEAAGNVGQAKPADSAPIVKPVAQEPTQAPAQDQPNTELVVVAQEESEPEAILAETRQELAGPARNASQSDAGEKQPQEEQTSKDDKGGEN